WRAAGTPHSAGSTPAACSPGAPAASCDLAAPGRGRGRRGPGAVHRGEERADARGPGAAHQALGCRSAVVLRTPAPALFEPVDDRRAARPGAAAGRGPDGA